MTFFGIFPCEVKVLMQGGKWSHEVDTRGECPHEVRMFMQGMSHLVKFFTPLYF